MSVATQYETTRDPGETAAVPRLVPAQSVTTTKPAVPVSVLFLGLVAAVVAAWGAAAPYFGPELGYVADRVGAWQWSATSACLGLGPGVVALVAALSVVVMATRTSYARRADLWVLGLVVTVCGAWFVVGQYVWPVVYGTGFIARSTSTHFMWKELVFAIGPGVILVFCGAVFMGWAVRRQLALVADRYSRVSEPSVGTMVAEPVPGAVLQPNAGPVAATATGTMMPPVAVPIVAVPARGDVRPAPTGGGEAAAVPETFEPPAGALPAQES